MEALQREQEERKEEVLRLVGTVAERLQMNVEARERFGPDGFRDTIGAQLFGGDGLPGYNLDNPQHVEQVATLLDAAYRAVIELQHTQRLCVKGCTAL